MLNNSAAKYLPGWLSRDHSCWSVAHRRLTLPDSIEELLATLPRKTRHNYRTYARRLGEEYGGQVKVRCFRQEQEMDYFLGMAEGIASKTYHRKVGGGFVNDATTREEIIAAARNGCLSAYVPYVADQPCAFLVGKQNLDTFYACFTGYDPAYRRFAPGLIVLLHCVQDLVSRKGKRVVQKYDFGPGSQRYNRSVGNEEWQEETIYIFAPTAKALVIKAFRTCLVLAHRFTRSVLVRTNVRDELVRAWRSMVVRYRPKLSDRRPEPID